MLIMRSSCRLLSRLSLLALVAVLASACRNRHPGDEIFEEEREDNSSTCPAGDGSGPTPSFCGCWRWFVKTGVDKSVGSVSTAIVDTDIGTLRNRGGGQPPGGLVIQTGRMLTGAYQEVTTYRLKNVQLIGCRNESDSDMHLILADGTNAALTMVAEVPSTGPANECVIEQGFGTPWKAQIAAARSAFLGATTCQTTYSPAKIVTVTGVGFFDDPHGQTGGSANGIELHPVVSICFGQDCGATAGGPFSVGGTVSGLAGTGLQLKNGAEILAVAANGSFTFPTKLPSGTAYAVTVNAQPGTPSQTCTVANGSGTIGGDVTTVAVTCATNSYSIKGTISGLVGSNVILRNNAEDLPIAGGATTFSFPTKVVSGQGYSVSVKAQPTAPAQTCTVASPTGTVAGADVSVAITCTTNTYSISGHVLGLTVSTLSLTNGVETLPIAPGADVPFLFTTKVASGQAYAVTSSLAGCRVSGGSGTVVSANVTSVVVNCDASLFTVGGTVSGLAGGAVVLTNNNAGDLAISANGQFSFAQPMATGTAYLVAVKTQPSQPTQSCSVSAGTGNIAGANVTSVAVTCATSAFALGGTVTGLQGTGLQLRNGAEVLSLAAGATTFAFSTRIASGAVYQVSIEAQPGSPAQTCTLSGGSGEVGTSDVTSVAVACTTNTYGVGATLSGLEGDGLVLHLASGSVAEDLQISGGATSTAFASKLSSGASFLVTVAQQPAAPNQVCTLSRASGQVGTADLDVGVSCVTSSTADAGAPDAGAPDAGTPDAGPKCSPGSHVENGKCVVDVSGAASKSGCASVGSSAWALFALAGLLLRRRRTASARR